MKKRIIHNVCICLALLLLASCKEQTDTPLQEDGMVTLSISAAMVSRAVDTGDDNRIYSELMHTLRIIIFNEDGTIEHNRLYTFDEGLFKSENHNFLVKANQTKNIYLLANCESFAVKEGDNPTISILDKLELNAETGILQDQGTNAEEGESKIKVLPATAKYEINVGETSQTETLYVVHAANKIQFQFVNYTGKEIALHSWSLYSIAPESYLVPRVNEADWFNTVQGETDNAITDYDIPVAPDEHQEYTYLYETPIQIPTTTEGETGTVTPADNEQPIYLHESKFLVPAEAAEEPDAEEWTDQQQYTITFNISRADEDDSKPYTAMLDNLPSLFRGTYVKIKVTLNELEEGEGPDGIYADIQMWEYEDPVTGELVPVDTD